MSDNPNIAVAGETLLPNISRDQLDRN